LCLGPASRSYRKKTESAAAPRAVPDSLALGYARLLIVEERQLAQWLAVAHDIAAYLVATSAQELVRPIKVYTSLDTKPFGVCRPRSHRDGRRRVACHPVPLSARGLFSPRVCQRFTTTERDGTAARELPWRRSSPYFVWFPHMCLSAAAYPE
jgi:hypothetical protein